MMGRVTDRAAVLNLWQWRQSQLTDFSPTRPMSSYVVDGACGTSSSEEFGCSDLERLQNISVYRSSQMAAPRSSLPAWHAAVNLVGNQNKRGGGGCVCSPLVSSSHFDVCFLSMFLIKQVMRQQAVIWFLVIKSMGSQKKMFFCYWQTSPLYWLDISEDVFNPVNIDLGCTDVLFWCEQLYYEHMFKNIIEAVQVALCWLHNWLSYLVALCYNQRDKRWDEEIAGTNLFFIHPSYCVVGIHPPPPPPPPACTLLSSQMVFSCLI